jgi:hypothetical protein
VAYKKGETCYFRWLADRKFFPAAYNYLTEEKADLAETRSLVCVTHAVSIQRDYVTLLCGKKGK